MSEQPKVYVFTRAYNAEKTIHRAIESVLNQTYRNISYVIRDNGSTDDTYALCKEYQKKDERVILVHNEKNNVFETAADKAAVQAEIDIRCGAALGDNDFFCLLDADDEYMPDFFEQGVRFAQEEHLDIVVGGSVLIQEETGETIGERIPANNFCITGQGFVEYFPQYHWYMRQVWGKLFRKRVLLGTQEYRMSILQKELGERAALKLPYGDDTICVLYNFQQAKRVGLLSDCQHRYYIQKKSVSHTVPSNRVEADRILHKVAMDFLIEKGDRPICEKNRSFLAKLYANSVKETANLLHDSALPQEDKLEKYYKIASEPLTKAIYREYSFESAAQSRYELLLAVFWAGSGLGEKDDRYLRATIQELSPHCGRAVTGENLMMFLTDQELMQALIQDDPEIVLQNLLSRMERNQDTKKHAIPQAIQGLTVYNPLLCQISDADFLRKYAQIYLMVWRRETLAALDEMTGLLLENQVTDGKETFLQLYISLAALENQASAFVFGKFQLAWFLLQRGRKGECQIVVDELTELGIECEELSELQKKLY